MQRVHAKVGDADEGERIAEQGENCSGAELFERGAKIELKPSREENQDQGERSKSAGYFAELRAVHPVQHRPQRDAGDEQNDHVRNARPFRKPVGDKRKNQQRAQQSEESCEAGGHNQLEFLICGAY